MARAAPGIPVDGYAAVVNGRVILVSDVHIQMQPVVRQMKEAFSGAELEARLEAAYTNALEHLIERELIISDFYAKGASIPDNIVESRIEEIIRNRFNGNRAELLKALEADGMTWDEWREDIRNQFIISVQREREVESRIHITPSEMREAYEQNIEKYRIPEQVDLRMIVISRGKTEEEKAVKRKQVEEIRRRLLAGEDFGELARAVSEGVKADAGGHHGWIDPATRREELRRAIAALAPGEISEIIETEEDFFIIKIDGRKNAGLTPFEKAGPEIREKLHAEKAQRLYDEWVSRLKEKAYIKKF